MKILAVCRGSAEILPGAKYKTGINKTSLAGPVMVDAEGIVGDAICNRRHHGGVDQALCIEGTVTRAWWTAQLGRTLDPGAFGENLLIDGLDNCDLACGDRLTIGEIELEVTSARIPCNTFAARMGDPGFVRRYTRAGRPGAYCRVITGGLIESGQAVTMLPYPGDRIGLAEMMATFGKRLEGAERARYLASPINMRVRAFLEESAADR